MFGQTTESECLKKHGEYLQMRYLTRTISLLWCRLCERFR